MIDFNHIKRLFKDRLYLIPIYLLLKKDMIRKLKNKHGGQFITDVMETFNLKYNDEEKNS